MATPNSEHQEPRQGQQSSEGAPPSVGTQQPQQPQTNGSSGGDSVTAEERPVAVFKTNEQLNERLDRHLRSQLRAYGVDDPAQIKSIVEEHRAMKEREEEQRRAQMSEQERLNAELEEARKARERAEEEADMAAFESHVTTKCAELGIRNVDYAMYMVAKTAEGLDEEEELDVSDYLKSQLEEPRMRAAFGVEAPVEQVQVPAQTTTHGPDGNPRPKGETGGEQPVDVMQMSEEEYRRYRAEKYGI